MSFFYTLNGDYMKIYVDVVVFINFFFDFLLLFATSYILKRNTKIYKILLGALIGSISILLLFIKISSLQLFIFKIIVSVLMILVTFNFKNIKYFLKNLLYLYIVSIILGGFLYFINNLFSYKSNGLVFFNNHFSINIIIIILISPVILYLYIKTNKTRKETYNNRYLVNITLLNGNKLNLTGFIDSGNNLYDPYKKRPIILINKEILKNYKPRCILVPCTTINKKSMIRCFKIRSIVVNGKKINNNILIGISDNNFNIEGVDLLLHSKLLERIKI